MGRDKRNKTSSVASRALGACIAAGLLWAPAAAQADDPVAPGHTTTQKLRPAVVEKHVQTEVSRRTRLQTMSGPLSPIELSSSPDGAISLILTCAPHDQQGCSGLGL